MAAGRSLCLLVGDERDDSLHALCRLLRLSGHTVHMAKTVAAMRALTARGICQIAIIEPGMGGGAGLELMAEFKSAGLLAIALTSHDTPEWIEAVERAGFNHCMLKPIHYDDLVEAVENLADRIDDPCKQER